MIKFITGLPHYIEIGIWLWWIYKVSICLDGLRGTLGWLMTIHYWNLLSSLICILLIESLQLMLELLAISLVELTLSEDVTLLLWKLILRWYQLNVICVCGSLRNGRREELLWSHGGSRDNINQLTYSLLLLWVKWSRLVVRRETTNCPWMITAHYMTIKVCLRYWHSLSISLHIIRTKMLLRLELLLLTKDCLLG